MRSFRSFASSAMACFRHPAAFILTATLLLSPCAYGSQQPATGRKKVPRLTTDDIVNSKTAQPVEESAKDAATAKPGDATDAAKPDATKAQAGGTEVSPEEASWRESVNKARARAKELERSAEETELRVTQLRNDLTRSGQGAAYRNQTAAELDSAGKRLTDLRAQSRAAASDLNQLLEYGKQKGYTEAAGPKEISDNGKPNEKYYTERYATLMEELKTADRRVQLYENRVRDLNQRITNNSVSGDNFYISHLQQEREESQQKMEEARSARTKAQNDIAALKEEARRAGLPPGIFR